MNRHLKLSLDTIAGNRSAASPQSALLRARRIAVAFGIGYGILAGAAAGLAAGILAGFPAGVIAGVIGWVAAWASGPALTPWGMYQVARAFLALDGQLPWRTMAFLEDAHHRDVMRQAGAVYQFRHIELQRRLASRNAGKPRR